MKDLMFFDAGCRIGNQVSGPGCSAAQLLELMDQAGIDKALVAHNGLVFTPQTTNKLICNEINTCPERLKGVWCMLPQQCDEFPSVDTLFDEMRANGICALTLEPFEHRYVPCRLTLGKVMDAAAERKVPILLENFSVHWEDPHTRWTELYHFLAEFPKNTYIFRAIYGKWGIDRQIRPLLENYPGFHFALSGYWVPEGIRDLAEIYGAERLLFATGYPVFNHGNQMLQLKYSGLPAEDVAKIAGQNMERILKEAQL